MVRSVLFVCLGNICRSPMAEGALTALAGAEGLDLTVDSAATGDWHTGEPPYPPAVAAAAVRGYDIAGQRARPVTAADFDRFDLVLAMDGANYDNLQRLRPREARAELKRFMDYAPETGRDAVPDPYYTRDFEEALDLIEAGAKGLLAAIRS
ncbi:low molecular weight phosphotyrosine protein phosphatase [Psychromarinibacter sp. C21-152]|uniref:protein-tyrosine-phosphatase n=1 Tax=Psychromarinibacter sediminicola TaxID=3033385 RepID=A0AAE3NYP1_9RHOB|nr:low molecular weight protein-tyrosine-phosphatase [Psychromarinibacter sediminicola]MDF0603330.1 low molecular weight phosphotyrosine protein phosphatase [Psychromarinibacter sediminicola]